MEQTDAERAEAARTLSSYRPKVELTCVVCGAMFTGYPYALTCSSRCRTARHRLKAKGQEPTGTHAAPGAPTDGE
jgi:hypothetical protein